MSDLIKDFNAGLSNKLGSGLPGTGSTLAGGSASGDKIRLTQYSSKAG